MAFNAPDTAAFKAYFNRDFPYGADIAQNVLDQDIVNALATTAARFNSELWSSQDKYTLGYLLLTAHNLVMAIRASTQGIAGTGSWLETSKAVGSVSQGFTVPQRILDNPSLAILSKTQYGMRYLELVLPLITGPMFTSEGFTKP